MSKSKKSHSCEKDRRIKFLQTPRVILKVRAFTPIAKPLNGSLPQSNTSHLLKLTKVSYQYKSKSKGLKEEKATLYHIKGLRGAIRHQVMAVCQNHRLEVCHTTDKETDKGGNKFLPQGFHLLGACQNNHECIIHQVFGSKGHSSKFSIHSVPIAFTKHETAQCERPVRFLQISTENRVCLSYEGKSVQDFNERYFSGEFVFELDVTNCNDTQIGMLVEAVVGLKKFGRGYNAGYGVIKVLEFELVKRVIENRIVKGDNGRFKVVEKFQEHHLDSKVIEAVEAWQYYVAAHT